MQADVKIHYQNIARQLGHALIEAVVNRGDRHRRPRRLPGIATCFPDADVVLGLYRFDPSTPHLEYTMTAIMEAMMIACGGNHHVVAEMALSIAAVAEAHGDRAAAAHGLRDSLARVDDSEVPL